MDPAARNAYLETQIATASPQRLRLMLIEAALRLANQSAHAWNAEREDDALETLMRCRSVVTELISGIRAGSSPLADRVLGIYLFLFQDLTEAQLRRDRGRIGGIIRVLEEERETWQELCLATAQSAPSGSSNSLPEILAPASVAGTATCASRFSLEA